MLRAEYFLGAATETFPPQVRRRRFFFLSRPTGEQSTVVRALSAERISVSRCFEPESLALPDARPC